MDPRRRLRQRDPLRRPEDRLRHRGDQGVQVQRRPRRLHQLPQTKAGGLGTIVDTVLYSPIFGPAHTGTAANGQPWNYEWQSATWYFRSDMVALADPALAVGFFWDRDYPGVSTPGVNEIYDYYPYNYGYFYYPEPGLGQRYAVERHRPAGEHRRDQLRQRPRTGHVWDSSGAGRSRSTTPTWAATRSGPPRRSGLALDNLNLAYAQYHADGQVGSCAYPSAVVSFDRFRYLQCPSEPLGISVLDGNASGAVQVTVVSETTGDSETFSIYGAGPNFTATLPSSTAGGPRAERRDAAGRPERPGPRDLQRGLRAPRPSRSQSSTARVATSSSTGSPG